MTLTFAGQPSLTLDLLLLTPLGTLEGHLSASQMLGDAGRLDGNQTRESDSVYRVCKLQGGMWPGQGRANGVESNHYGDQESWIDS